MNGHAGCAFLEREVGGQFVHLVAASLHQMFAHVQGEECSRLKNEERIIENLKGMKILWISQIYLAKFAPESNRPEVAREMSSDVEGLKRLDLNNSL